MTMYNKEELEEEGIPESTLPVIPMQPPPQIVTPRPKGVADEVGELTNVTEEDIMGRIEDNVPQELDDEDMDDLFNVDDEVLLEPLPEKTQQPRYRIVKRPRYYPTPPSIMSGLR